MISVQCVGRERWARRAEREVKTVRQQFNRSLSGGFGWVWVGAGVRGSELGQFEIKSNQHDEPHCDTCNDEKAFLLAGIVLGLF